MKANVAGFEEDPATFDLKNVAGFEEDPATFDFEDVAASVRYRILPHSTFLSPCFVTGFVRCRKLAKDTLLLRVYGQIPEQQTDELDSFIFLGMLRDPHGVFIDDSKTTSLLEFVKDTLHTPLVLPVPCARLSPD